MNRIKSILFVCLIFSLDLFSQNFNLRLIKTDAEKFPYLISALQVYDNSDEPITNLKNSDFVATLEGKQADSVLAITYNNSGIGINIMLCVDISGSMTGEPIKAMKNAILKFIDDMRSVDKLGIIGFADDAELISDFSNNKEYLKQKVNDLQPKGSHTALFYGAYKGIKALADNKDNTGKILMLIGDGKNESLTNTYSENDVIEFGIKEGIPVFTIGYTKIDPSYLQSLEKISEKTNGNYYNSPTDKDLERQYAKLYRQILNIYLIKYVIHDMKGDGNEHVNSLSVRYQNATKSASKKIIVPAGVTAAEGENKIIHEPTPWWHYALPIAIILLIAAIGFFIAKKRKEAKEAEDKRREEEQKKNSEALEVERKKRVEVEKKLEDVKKPSDTLQSSFDDKTKTVGAPKFSSQDERTIILKPSSGNSNATLRIEFTIGVFSGQRYDISNTGATLGRKDDNTIVLKEGTVSGNHAKISFVSGNFFIEDLSSSNGTFVNGKQVNQSPLQHGDVFKLGQNEGTVTVF